MNKSFLLIKKQFFRYPFLPNRKIALSNPKSSNQLILQSPHQKYFLPFTKPKAITPILKYFLFAIFLALFSQGTFLVAQTNQVDSLLKVLSRQSEQDSNRAITLYKLCGKLILSNSRRALEYGKESLALSEKLGFKKGIAGAENNIGIVYQEMGDYEKAADYYLKSITIKEAMGNKRGLISAYSNLGEVFDIQGNFEKANFYYSKSLAIATELKDTSSLANSYLDIGVVEFEKSNFSSGIDYSRKAFFFSQIIGDSSTMANALNNLGVIYENKTMLDSAFYYYGMATLIREQSNNDLGLLNSYNNMGSINIRLGNFKQAESWFLKSIDLQKNLQALPSLKTSYQGLAEVYDSLRDYQNSKKYLLKYNDVRDSIFSLKSLKEVSRMELDYEQDKKEKEDQAKQNEDKIRRDDAEHEQKVVFYFLLTIILVVSGFSVFLFTRFRVIRKQKGVIEVKTKEIVDSITYAKRIQDSILPSEELLKTIFPESFIFSLPRDIVSGDFYWFSERDEKVFIAVADCTGHGVPGALMSMIGNTLLNEIVNEKKIHSPAEILFHLDEGIAKALRQGNSEAGGQDDGMDISFCVIDRTTKEISFSGANHSLYVFSNGKLEEIKGEVYSIGGMFGKNQKSFSEKTILADRSTKIYFTTDGFYDQFGGNQNKKFMSQKFLELLSGLGNEKMEEQKKTIMDAFFNWKGNHKQVDDVLVIGVKI
jgi:tetratricopeptide (TPR) repeat protein